MQKHCDRERGKTSEFDGVTDDEKNNFMSKLIKIHNTIINKPTDKG